MSDNKTIDNVHVHIYGHEMLGEVISRARKNNIPYDKEMQYDFHSHGHVYLVHQQGQLTLVEDPTPNHSKEGSLNDLFELYFSKDEVKELEIGKWYKTPHGGLYCVVSIEDKFYNAYGFSVSGYWFENEGIPKGMVRYDRPATPQEVGEALIKEAERRGFGKCVKYIPISKIGKLNDDFYTGQHDPSFFNDSYRVTIGMQWIFADGQWATIIEQDKFDEGLKIGDKVIGIRTDCAIIGEVTSVSKKKVCVNNLAFLKDQVSPLTAVQYDDVRFLINGLKGHD